jgi:hypothetical protein
MLVRSVALSLVLTLTAMPAAAEEKAKAGGDKVICKKFQETGSLVKKKKRCFTESEWTRIQTSQNEGSRKFVQELSGGFNGNN